VKNVNDLDNDLVTIVIPVYNESDNIGTLLNNIKNRCNFRYEILVIDDGSTDGTQEIAENNGAKVIRFDENKGKGEAMIKGIRCANGDSIVFIDGDGQDDPGDIAELIKPIYQDGADFVNGSRFLGTFEKDSITKRNYYLTVSVNKLVSFMFNHDVTDIFAGFRAFKKSSIENIKFESKEYEIETEMLIKSIILGLNIVEVPVTRSKRQTGTTKLKILRHGSRIMFAIFKYYLLFLFRNNHDAKNCDNIRN
jgi:glycosyltransferase involved in cell wall biosynthesis